MSDATDPDAIRTRSFSIGRRGFEKAEVEAFQQELASLVGELQQRLSTTDERLTQLGITELPDLKAEFDTVGEDVRDILQAARDAAEDMRDRARADAAARLNEAQAQAEGLRGDAWNTSELMLQQVSAEAAQIAAQASEDALFIRAEAEREALRMTGDARRDAEEMVRSAQDESETILQSARSESESTLESATQSTDLAQERVRALEQRREELMKELEEARHALTELEETIDGKRSELTHATTDPAESSVRVLTEEEKPSIGDWLDADATVRLVPPLPAMPLDPVDADELVAEVESLRAPLTPEAGPLSGASASSAEAASLDFEITSGDTPVVADSAATAEVFADATPEEAADLAANAEPADIPAEAESPDGQPDAPLEEGEGPAEPADEVEAAPELEPVAASSAESEDSGISDLFASLRSPEELAAAAPSAPDQAAALSDEGVERETARTAVATVDPAPISERPAEVATAPTPSGSTGVEPWDLRDEMLVPVTNEVLRGIKRAIVDVQNLVLEELRTEADDWRPKRAMFDSVLSTEAEAVASRAYVAGLSAAGDLAAKPVPDVPVLPTHSLSGLVTDLWEAVVDAIDGTSGGSSRERGASVGRIFRAWRTDEAERRVRQVAHAEYNAGVAAALDALSISHTMVPAGRDLADPDATVVPAI